MNQDPQLAIKENPDQVIMDFRLSGIDYKPQVFMVEIERSEI